MTKLAIALCPYLCLLTACASVQTAGDLAPPDPNQAIAFGVCPKHLCGSNSDIGGTMVFRLDGKELHGFRLLDVRGPEGQQLTLRASKYILQAVDADGEVLTGEQLIGVELRFWDSHANNIPIIEIAGFEAAGVESTRWPNYFYPTYQFSLRFSDLPGAIFDLCGRDDWWGPDELPVESPNTRALIAQHEAYDWYGNPLVTDDDEDSEQWVTIGCSGGAFAKKVLMGYDLNNDDPENATTRAENDAVMHMLSARYCDRGQNHTAEGVPLYWQNRRGWFEPPPDAELEAIWDEHGAVCLNTPRFGRRHAVIRECDRIPRCDNFDPADYDLASYHSM